MKNRANEPHRWWSRSLPPLIIIAAVLTGCIHQPEMLPLSRQKLIDRKQVEFPGACTFVEIVKGLNCPTAVCWNNDGDMLIAESGIDGSEPHIFGYHKDHSYFNIYPWKRSVSFYPTGFVMYGPIGGMACYQNRIYVSHRDREGKGVITALGYDGTHTTIVADLPAQGDYGVTDVAINNGRVYFGVGTATNSAIVGLDNFAEGWAKRYPEVHDQVYSPPPTYTPWKLLGFRFDTPNPFAGLFRGDLAVTGPFQAFGRSNESRIRPSDKPNGAVYSVGVDGGNVNIEAYGLHNPRGIAFDTYGRRIVSNDGMEARGTRPVVNDPCVLVRISSEGGWYGWPDYTTDFHEISDPYYRPPVSMLSQSGYPELSPLVDKDASGLHLPSSYNLLVYGEFPSLSGAAKIAIIPGTGPFKDLKDDILVALDGDRAPFATNGLKLLGRQGFKVVLVDWETHQVTDFVHNTAGVPVSMQPFGTPGLERPCDVKVGPDGAIYILDFGRMDNDNAIPRYFPGTGGLFKLDAIATTKPANSEDQK